MNKTIKQLEKEEAKIRAKKNRLIEEERARIYIPALKKMVGKCFAYRQNSYGGAETPSDCWDVFKRILDYVESEDNGFNFIVEEFSIDKNGAVSLSVESSYPYPDGRAPFSGYEEIGAGEYFTERMNVLAELANHTKIRAVLTTKQD